MDRLESGLPVAGFGPLREVIAVRKRMARRVRAWAIVAGEIALASRRLLAQAARWLLGAPSVL